MTQDSTKMARKFVQDFYDLYSSIDVDGAQFNPIWKVVSDGKYLDEGVSNALRSDSAATVNQPHTRVLLDFDPFLGGQDRCRLPPKVTEMRREGRAFVATVLTCIQSANETTGPTVDAFVIPVNGALRIANFSYGSDLDLKSYLCKLGKADVRPDRRPTSCWNR